MAHFGMLVGTLLDPILWLIAAALGYTFRNNDSALARFLIVSSAVFIVGAGLNASVSGSFNPIYVITSSIYGSVMSFFFKPKKVSTDEDSE